MLRNVFIGQKEGSFIHDKILRLEYIIERTTKDGHFCKCTKNYGTHSAKEGNVEFLTFFLHCDFSKGKLA